MPAHVVGVHIAGTSGEHPPGCTRLFKQIADLDRTQPHCVCRIVSAFRIDELAVVVKGLYKREDTFACRTKPPTSDPKLLQLFDNCLIGYGHLLACYPPTYR